MKISRAAALVALLAAAGAGWLGAAWRQAAPGNVWSFPRDHWAHPEFRNEWWYFTGILDEQAGGRRFGYQFTVFRIGLAEQEPELDSRWSTRQLFMGHAAASDLSVPGSHRFSDVLYRDIPLLAGFETFPDPRLAWSLGPAGTPDPWELRWNGEAFSFRMGDAGRRFALDLATRPAKPMVLEGPGGYSRKGEGPSAASFYYSFTRLETSGTVTLDGRSVAVRGTSWMDREMSTTALASDQEGWDWFGLRLADGRDLMLYALRQKSGGSFRRGTIVDAQGKARYLEPGEWSARSLDRWRSPRTGTEYPSRWRVSIPGEGLELEVIPILPDQENVARRSADLAYWEGAVRVSSHGSEAGEGYMELTGYGRHSRPPL